MNQKFKIADNLQNTDYIMNNTFFLGTYPGLEKEMFEYVEKILEAYMMGVR